MKDKISVIIPAYNRAHTIMRAINSVIGQTFTNVEIIIVDDGSSDNTLTLLNKINDNRLKLIQHKKNRGVTSAKNSGLNNISGEWFTFLDSDDEMVSHALESMIKVPYEIDETITAITCNCIDAKTGEFTGKGIEKDQYISLEMVVKECRGEHWGITKTSLLGDDRFNEKLPGFEATLWYKICSRAKRYYINQGLRIYHTEGENRVTKVNYAASTQRKANIYRVLLNEKEYWKILGKYDPDQFTRMCLQGLIYLMAVGEKQYAKSYHSLMKQLKVKTYFNFMADITMLCGPILAKGIIFTNNNFRKL